MPGPPVLQLGHRPALQRAHRGRAEPVPGAPRRGPRRPGPRRSSPRPSGTRPGGRSPRPAPPRRRCRSSGERRGPTCAGPSRRPASTSTATRTGAPDARTESTRSSWRTSSTISVTAAQRRLGGGQPGQRREVDGRVAHHDVVADALLAQPQRLAQRVGQHARENPGAASARSISAGTRRTWWPPGPACRRPAARGRRRSRRTGSRSTTYVGVAGCSGEAGDRTVEPGVQPVPRDLRGEVVAPHAGAHWMPCLRRMASMSSMSSSPTAGLALRDDRFAGSCRSAPVGPTAFADPASWRRRRGPGPASRH